MKILFLIGGLLIVFIAIFTVFNINLNIDTKHFKFKSEVTKSDED
ncbi:hypothetical protein R9X47_24475 [Wukongibacter baidiensis]